MTAFHPLDSGSSDFAGATAYFEEQVFYFNAGSGGRLYMLVNTEPTDGDPASSQWTNGALPESDLGIEAKTDTAPTAVVAGDYLYLFWLDSDKNQLLAARYQNGKWSKHVVCRDATTVIGDSETAISAVTYSSNQIFVGKTSARDANGFYPRWHYVFDPTAWPKSTDDVESLKATFQQRCDYTNETKPGRFISISWFTQGGIVGSNGDTQNFVVVSYLKGTTHDVFEARATIYRITTDGKITTDTPQPETGDFGNKHIGISLKRDPAGRVRALGSNYTPRGKDLITPIEDPPIMQSSVLDTLTMKWTPIDLIAGAEACATPPQVEYLIGEEVEVDTKTMRRPVREWIFYTLAVEADRPVQEYWEPGDIRCAEAECGNLYRKQADPVDLTAASVKTPPVGHPQGLWYLKGVIDGPLPLPLANCLGQPDTEVSGNITYGTTEDNSKSHEVTQSLKVGVKTSGEVGIGAKLSWDISASAGTGSSWGTTEATSVMTALTQSTNRINDQFLAIGNAFVTGVNITRADYYYIPTGESEPVGGCAEFAEVGMEFSSPVAQAYDLFTVEPGDISSYTNEAWNEKMGPDYFDTMIVANALPLAGDKVVGKALDFSWTTNGDTTTDFGSTKSQFTESSWSLDASVWAGVQFKFWDVVDVSVLAGVDFSMDTSDKTEESSTLAMNFNFQCPPAPISPPSGYTSYQFEVFLTKPMVEFTKEFIDKCPDRDLAAKIDPNSASWKIVSRVVRWAPDGPTGALIEHGLDAADIERMHGQKLRTMADLCGKYRLSNRDSIHNALTRDRHSDEDRKILTAYLAWHKAKAYVYQKHKA